MDAIETTTSVTDPGWTWHEYAPGCRVLHCPGKRQYWVFGLKWLPTVGARSRKLLLRQLRRERIRWWAGPQTGAGTVGFLPHAPKGSIREAHGHSAAVQYASQRPVGAHMLILRLQGGRHWVVAVSEGNVLSQTDCWVDSQEQVQDIESSIRQRFINLQIDQHDLPESDLSSASALDFLRNPRADSRATLRRLRTFPAKWILLLALVTLCLIAWVRWAPSVDGRGSHRESAHHQLHIPPNEKAVIELITPADVSRVAQIWNGLPVDPPGWLLERVFCDWGLRTVDCRAIYSRQAPGVTNLHLSSVVEAGWQIVPSSIDRTEAVRSLPYRPRRLRHDELSSQPVEKEAGSGWLTSLQDLSAFTYSIELSQPVPVIDLISANVADELGSHSQTDGTGAYDGDGRPASSLPAQRLQRRMIRLSLPLRHLSRVESLPVLVRWKSMHLEVLSPSLEQSRTTRLRAYLEGDLIDVS
ncbi:type 4b pilus protein PilO2 [Orrella marina]|uniref:type 4b pilus protein PilO2 n=1 Tax=Orrella marina TaxID=2163011 RepID=UPI00131ED5FA|nr:type 4b pilus protein PilO2 [Orrella marina]